VTVGANHMLGCGFVGSAVTVGSAVGSAVGAAVGSAVVGSDKASGALFSSALTTASRGARAYVESFVDICGAGTHAVCFFMTDV